MPVLLVANRGEIAIRIFKTAKKLGFKCVAVYSEADRNSLHVRFADEAYCIGPAASVDSYLNIPNILDAAKKANANFIHPGYGFLSENPVFSKAVEDAGIIFIGPSPEAMRLMGDKLSAKNIARINQVPLVPGSKAEILTIDAGLKISEEIGYPVMIKAAAGGGGKGMRLVHSPDELPDAFTLAGNEAMSSFGNRALFIEKYISSPRHIEIQIIADRHGDAIYFPERECSIQRRHQKLIEESPSVILNEEKRQEMGQAAIRLAKACAYTSTGTVEFILDENLNFYFLEMNTRLQVEHAVTEMICGMDLVELQIKIAQDKKLPFSQEDIKINGHAIELRVCAEDPNLDFSPSSGMIQKYIRPDLIHIRLDDGYEQGQSIPIYYDPMIAKLVSWGTDRENCRNKMIEAIENYKIAGIQTTLSLGKKIMQETDFIEGKLSTHYIDQHLQALIEENKDENIEKAAAHLALHLYSEWINRLKLPV